MSLLKWLNEAERYIRRVLRPKAQKLIAQEIRNALPRIESAVNKAIALYLAKLATGTNADLGLLIGAAVQSLNLGAAAATKVGEIVSKWVGHGVTRGQVFPYSELALDRIKASIIEDLKEAAK